MGIRVHNPKSVEHANHVASFAPAQSVRENNNDLSLALRAEASRENMLTITVDIVMLTTEMLSLQFR